jgi:hypothetical protein
MPRKSTPPLTDQERAKRIRVAAREAEASENKEDFERALKKIVPPKREPRGE